MPKKTETGNELDKIRERAHTIWEEEGRPEGKDVEHWERARKEVLGDAVGSGAGSPPKKPSRRPTAKRA